jgi:hypothetical protein
MRLNYTLRVYISVKLERCDLSATPVLKLSTARPQAAACIREESDLVNDIFTKIAYNPLASGDDASDYGAISR